MGNQRVLFLYSELAGYFINCAQELAIRAEVEAVGVVHWPINPEAPFQFDDHPNVARVDKSTLPGKSLVDYVLEFDPTLLVVAGWMDSAYCSIAKSWKDRIPVVVCIDNWWTGSLKQRVASLLSPWHVRRMFNHAWVPGKPQRDFARRLGFNHAHILEGYYCADPRPFELAFQMRKGRNPVEPMKRMLYVGRYLDFKGVLELWQAFMELAHDHPDWELHCIGTGDLWEQRQLHPRIIHHGFIQPHEMAEHIARADCFVMPSRKEPWGVVLHEMAIAGLPLLASEAVGSASVFLNHGVNGFLLNQVNWMSQMRTFMELPDQERRAMGEESRKLGVKHSPRRWGDELLKLV
jgi:glycosyltransferase involved in cell wall biosynthesis